MTVSILAVDDEAFFAPYARTCARVTSISAASRGRECHRPRPGAPRYHGLRIQVRRIVICRLNPLPEPLPHGVILRSERPSPGGRRAHLVGGSVGAVSRGTRLVRGIAPSSPTITARSAFRLTPDCERAIDRRRDRRHRRRGGCCDTVDTVRHYGERITRVSYCVQSVRASRQRGEGLAPAAHPAACHSRGLMA